MNLAKPVLRPSYVGLFGVPLSTRRAEKKLLKSIPACCRAGSVPRGAHLLLHFAGRHAGHLATSRLFQQPWNQWLQGLARFENEGFFNLPSESHRIDCGRGIKIWQNVAISR